MNDKAAVLYSLIRFPADAEKPECTALVKQFVARIDREIEAELREAIEQFRAHESQYRPDGYLFLVPPMSHPCGNDIHVQAIAFWMPPGTLQELADRGATVMIDELLAAFPSRSFSIKRLAPGNG